MGAGGVVCVNRRWQEYVNICDYPRMECMEVKLLQPEMKINTWARRVQLNSHRVKEKVSRWLGISYSVYRGQTIRPEQIKFVTISVHPSIITQKHESCYRNLCFCLIFLTAYIFNWMQLRVTSSCSCSHWKKKTNVAGSKTEGVGGLGGGWGEENTFESNFSLFYKF